MGWAQTWAQFSQADVPWPSQGFPSRDYPPAGSRATQQIGKSALLPRGAAFAVLLTSAGRKCELSTDGDWWTALR